METREHKTASTGTTEGQPGGAIHLEPSPHTPHPTSVSLKQVDLLVCRTVVQRQLLASWLIAQGPPRCGGDSYFFARGSDRRNGALPRPCITAGMQGRTLCTKPYGDKTASSGTRLAEPQVGAVTVGNVAAPGPLLVVASLAGGDEVDATTVPHHLSVSLAKKKEEEEERKKKVKRQQAQIIEEALRVQERTQELLRRKRKKKRLPRSSFRPSRQLWRRLRLCLPTTGTSSPAVSCIRRRVGLLVPVFLATVCGLLATTAQRHSVLDIAFPPGLWGEGGFIDLDVSEHPCGVAFDATVPEVALDMSEFLDKVLRCPFMHRQVPPMVQTVLFRGGAALAVYRPGRCRGAEAIRSWIPSCRTFGGRCPLVQMQLGSHLVFGHYLFHGPLSLAVTCSALYVAEECTKIRIFLGVHFRSCFRMQRLLARQWGPTEAGSAAFLGRGLLRVRIRRLGGRAVGSSG